MGAKKRKWKCGGCGGVVLDHVWEPGAPSPRCQACMDRDIVEALAIGERKNREEEERLRAIRNRSVP